MRLHDIKGNIAPVTAIWLGKHGFKDETKASIANKLARGTFAVAFLFACLAALEIEGVKLEDL